MLSMNVKNILFCAPVNFGIKYHINAKILQLANVNIFIAV